MEYITTTPVTHFLLLIYPFSVVIICHTPNITIDISHFSLNFRSFGPNQNSIPYKPPRHDPPNQPSYLYMYLMGVQCCIV